MKAGIVSDKRAQERMLETVMILVVFFFMLGIGLVMYARFRLSSSMQLREEVLNEKAVRISQTAFLPELECSSYNAEDCIDTLKMTAFERMLASHPGYVNTYYFDYFFYSNITVQSVYMQGLQGSDKRSWIIYQRTPERWSSRTSIRVPIALYDPVQKTSGFGVMRVEVYD